MEIRHLKLVKAVAEVGSLTKAGEQLFLSQSALSHQLKEIETELEAGKVSYIPLTQHGLQRTWYVAILNTAYQPTYLHNFSVI